MLTKEEMPACPVAATVALIVEAVDSAESDGSPLAVQ